jgi:hypothetical protein
VALGFERIRALLEKLENPHEELKTVQVVGTNGKGITAVALAGALEAAGVRSGAYLSPHVLSYTERIMLGGNRVSEQNFAAVMGGVLTLADRHEVPATQFELLTAGSASDSEALSRLSPVPGPPASLMGPGGVASVLFFPYSAECVEGEFSEVRGYRTAPTP